jgi:hypothetical protein
LLAQHAPGSVLALAISVIPMFNATRLIEQNIPIFSNVSGRVNAGHVCFQEAVDQNPFVNLQRRVLKNLQVWFNTNAGNHKGCGQLFSPFQVNGCDTALFASKFFDFSFWQNSDTPFLVIGRKKL